MASAFFFTRSFFFLLEPFRFQLTRPVIYLHCPTSGVYQLSRLCYSLVGRDFDCLYIPQGITLVYYTDDIMLIEPNEKVVAITPDLLIRHLCARRLGNKSDKNSGAFYHSEISRSPVIYTILAYSFKVEDKMLKLDPATIKKQTQYLMGPFGG